MSVHRVVVTGMGLLAPGGDSPEAVFARLLEAASSIKRVNVPYGENSIPFVCAPVEADVRSMLSAPGMATLDRCTQLGLAAVAQAMGRSGLQLAAGQRQRAGVYWGTGMGGAATIEAGYDDLFRKGANRTRPMTVPYGMINATSGQIGIAQKIEGPVLTISNACASSANAIGEAVRAIRAGAIDCAIAGGSESFLVYGVVKAWESLRVLALDDPADVAASCRPFSQDRTGLVLGEGAGALILESEQSAKARGAAILAVIAGYGMSNDATHLTKPSAEGQARAMRMALDDAALPATAIGYLNAHGTGTPVGDEVETQAVKHVFGDYARQLPVSATKSMHGHLMGASGALELIVSLQALLTRSIPPTANLRVPDPACDLDYVANAGRREVRLAAVMSNSFAFGGANATLIATLPS
jgi:3-oxoacyl-[acyl-carrier-protein] synthase II